MSESEITAGAAGNAVARDIKFRAWYPKAELMSEPFEPLMSNYSVTFVSPTAEETPPWNFSTDEFLFMQYTGLHDRNGKEIYEGDLVRIGSYDYTFEILFLEGQWVAQHGAMIDFPYDIKPIAVEVVGNVHERKGGE